MQTQRKYQERERPTAQIIKFPKKNLSDQGLAFIRVRELERLSYYCALHSLSTCSRSEWLWILGSTIAIAEGCEIDTPATAHRANARASRRGLTRRSLRESAMNAGFKDVRSTELDKAIDKAKAKLAGGEPVIRSASLIGKLVELTFVVRDELRIRTIDACDETREERRARVKERRRARDREYNRTKRNRKPRAQYEAESLTRQKPWDADGISRRTWYSRRKAEGASASPESLSKNPPEESMPDKDVTQPAQAAARKRRKPAALARPPHHLSGLFGGRLKA